MLKTPQHLTDLKNIGKTTVPWLNAIGIHTVEDLEAMADEVGVVGVWKRLKASRPDVTLLALYALQGALLDVHWNFLPDDLKADLRRQATEH